MKVLIFILVSFVIIACQTREHKVAGRTNPIKEISTCEANYYGDSTKVILTYKPTLFNKSNFKKGDTLYATCIFYSEDAIIYSRKMMAQTEEDTLAYRAKFSLPIQAFYIQAEFVSGRSYISEYYIPSVVYNKNSSVIEGGFPQLILNCPNLECADLYFKEDSINFPESNKRYYSYLHGLLKSGGDTGKALQVIDSRKNSAKNISQEEKIRLELIGAALYSDANDWRNCLAQLNSFDSMSGEKYKLGYFNEQLLSNVMNNLCKNSTKDYGKIVDIMYRIVAKTNSLGSMRDFLFMNSSPNNEDRIKFVKQNYLLDISNRILQMLEQNRNDVDFILRPDIYMLLVKIFISCKDYSKAEAIINYGVKNLNKSLSWTGDYVCYMPIEGTIASLELDRAKLYFAMGDSAKGIKHLQELVLLNKQNLLPSIKYAARLLSEIYQKKNKMDSSNYYLSIANAEVQAINGNYEVKLCVSMSCGICRTHTLSSYNIFREQLKGKAKVTIVADAEMIKFLKLRSGSDTSINYEESSPKLLSEYGIQGFPTIVVLSNNRVITRNNGIDDAISLGMAKSLMETLK